MNKKAIIRFYYVPELEEEVRVLNEISCDAPLPFVEGQELILGETTEGDVRCIIDEVVHYIFPRKPYRCNVRVKNVRKIEQMSLSKAA